MLKLNLGCSDDLRAGYVNVDVQPPCDEIFDLRRDWISRWGDSKVDEIYAHDVFEHIQPVTWIRADILWPADVLKLNLGLGGLTIPISRANSPKIEVMNQAWDILKPGGLLDLSVPCVYLSDGRVNPGAFADPTHVSYWTMDDLYYWEVAYNNPRGERGRLGPAYGIRALFKAKRWELIEYGEGRERRAKIVGLLEAIK